MGLMGIVYFIYRVNNCVGFALSLLLNSLLLWLIRKHSPAELSTYSMILTQTCAVDLLYALSIFLAMPITMPVGQALVTFQAGWLAETPLPLNYGLVSSTVIIYIFSFSATGVQFLYRYWAFVRGTHLTIRQYTAMLGVPLALATLTAVLQYIAAQQSNGMMRQIAEVLGPVVGVPSEELIVPAIGSMTSNAYVLLAMTVFTTNTGTYALIIWCYYRVSESIGV